MRNWEGREGRADDGGGVVVAVGVVAAGMVLVVERGCSYAQVELL